ncbi:protein phosphatase Slingshot homolog 3 isoform X2 [Brienomyrus brachyistius]|uniref:protein phosphatase Slingshot homolog 3 isoform X2 n=1 Tax=Brienomyrus brachyistius TaxID=42636 RepID=UPI0020B22184|nr:protein phosphatase Slingshot homolog 3 isoform X2 [Brienomyrus brachyistius]
MPTEELKQRFASGIKIRKEERDPKKGRRTGEEGQRSEGVSLPPCCTGPRCVTPGAQQPAGMALLTLHRTPSVCTPDEAIPKRGQLQKRESFALVKGAVLLLEEGEGREIGGTTPPLLKQRPQGSGKSETQHRHLHAMVSLLRPEDTLKLAVRLESVSPVRVRYLLVISTNCRKNESILLGVDFPNMESDCCTIGLVLPVWSDTQVYLDGDGGFSVTSAEMTRIFKPVSIQTMWSVLQALHGCCERAVKGAIIPGSGLSWARNYFTQVESDHLCRNEWGAMMGLESVRRDNMGQSSSERVSVERRIKAQLREIMRTEDLENITSKQVRMALEKNLNMDMKDYKEYIDNEMMVTMAQMDKPSKIFDYLFLGSEWNAANFEELQKNNVGYILNVTMEIDNFFPESFTYLNIRVYDVESTDLLSHWNNTYSFINKARQSGQAVLVHCKMGVSRSASTVVAFAMKQYQWSLDMALAHVRERRSIVKPNEGFMKQLNTYNGILSASQQRHNLLWKRKSREIRKMSEHGVEEASDEEEEEEEDDGSLEDEEIDEDEVFTEGPVDPLADSSPPPSPPDPPCPSQEPERSTHHTTVPDGDKVTQSPSRSGRMNLFSLMQSICELNEDEERGSDKEMAASQWRSPDQRRRSLGKRSLIHQKAHVDVSPEPRSLCDNRNLEKEGVESTVPKTETKEEESGTEGGCGE